MYVKTTPKTITVNHARDLTARWDDAFTEQMVIVTNHDGRGTWTVYRANGTPLAGGILPGWLAGNYIKYAASHLTRTWVAQRILTAGYSPGSSKQPQIR